MTARAGVPSHGAPNPLGGIPAAWVGSRERPRRQGVLWVLIWGLGLLLTPVAGAADAQSDQAGLAPAIRREPINLWPLYDARYDPVDRAEVRSGLGPLFYSARPQDGTWADLAVRPFYYRHRESLLDKEEVESLYPVLQYTRSEQDWQFQFLYVVDFRREGSSEAEWEKRADLFPLYLSGRTETGETYRWLFPFGGKAYDRLGRDEIEFVLFPLYVRTVWRGAERRFFLWPFFMITQGEGHTGFRLGSLYGEEQKEGVFQRQFVLWPFFIRERTDLDGDNPGENLVILPLYMASRSPQVDNYVVLWPFFHYVEDRARQFQQWSVAWPLFIIARGESRHVNRFLPFFTEERYVLRDLLLVKEMRVRNFAVLYPLYIRTEDKTATSLVVRDRILWWLYSDIRETGKDGDARRVEMWPFFRYVRNKEGWVTSQALALLEPLMPSNDVFERNWSPLWAIYTYRRNPEGDEAHSVLWNLVRVEATREGRAVEVLGPLFAYWEQGEESRLALLAGLLSVKKSQGVRSVRLLGQPILTWRDAPQPVASLDPAGGSR